MENNKLKKLGKYFTKGLQAGVLATALVTAVGCSQPSGGGNDDYEIDDPIIRPDDPIVKPGQEYPDFYINEEFGGQKFVGSYVDWGYDEQNFKNIEFTNRYADAQKFINAKVAELNQMIEDQDMVGLYKDIDMALKKYNQNANIGDNIYGNYEALAPVFYQMQESLPDDNNNAMFYGFNACYFKLAADAYNNSLGGVVW